MPGSTRTGYSDTLGLQLLRRLADEGRTIFTTEEARAAAVQVGITEGYLRLLLSRLAEHGWIQRLRRGLYAGAAGILGQARVHPFAIATRLVYPAAISHWSAMNFHGLTEQVPQGVTAFTPRKVVTPSMRRGSKNNSPLKHAWQIDGVRFEYVTVKPEHFFGIEEVWVDQNSRVPVTDRERTMLDGFISPRTFGGMGEVLSILEEHVHELDLGKLVEYARQYGKASVAKRLGWSLDQMGGPAEILAPLEEVPVTGFRSLDPTRSGSGPYDKRWMIQNNLAAVTTR